MRCVVNDGVEVPSAPTNYTPVTTAIKAGADAMGVPGGNGTPTAVAVQKAVAYLQTVKSSNPRYLVLTTDGEPNCADCNAGPMLAIDAVAAANAAGFHTFVVGVATDAQATDTLNKMAMAGGEPRAGTPLYYPVANRQDWLTTLGLITGLVSNCVFPLDKLPPSPDDVAATASGCGLARPAHANGWDYGAGNKSIQVYGPACDKIKMAAGQDVKITYGCPASPFADRVEHPVGIAPWRNVMVCGARRCEESATRGAASPGGRPSCGYEGRARWA